ncbi:MAG: hypothetical protein GAK28_00128 [Luteibacter sp.]|uniref:hypothetical protein n=1 Tax=Luteibacter sp. TaxID=1886636 RepID=UPI0013853108|nr:hypothetical protein [Luteibacter sp.]KAF1009490.1 MAG: hypothetical protein GAK28_00128 [Luteibacter sp.]
MPPSSNRQLAAAANLDRDRAAVQRDRAAVDEAKKALAGERAELETAKRELATAVKDLAGVVHELVAPAKAAPVTAQGGEKTAHALPSTICLTESFGFAVNGVLRHFPAGRAITNAEDIAMLFDRGASIEGYPNE